jgi:hypothetical protein
MPSPAVRRILSAVAIAAVAGGASFLSAGSARAGGGFTDETITNPAVNDELIPLGRGRMAELGSRSYVLYRTRFGWKPYAYVRDTATTVAPVHIALPEGSTPGYWEDASYAVSSNGDLWTLSGNGPVYVRRYSMTATTATLVSTTTFGDTDSRPGALTILASGAVVGVWHQQGLNGPNYHGVAYWTGSAWSTQQLGPEFMPSGTTKQAIAQQPGDHSVWLFSNADSWRAVGAARFTEAGGALALSWFDGFYIDVAKYGENTADRENPDLVAAADPSTNTIALAYQGDHRYIFSTSPVVTGSFPVVARVPATGTPTFTTLTRWVERISPLGLVVRAGEVWLAYRPINTSTMTFSNVDMSRLNTATGAWDAPVTLGTAYDNYGRIGSGLTRPEFTARLSDSGLHRFSTQAAPPSPTTTSTTAPSTTTSTTTTAKSTGTKKPRR